MSNMQGQVMTSILKNMCSLLPSALKIPSVLALQSNIARVDLNKLFNWLKVPSRHIGKHSNIHSPILSKNIAWHFHVNLLWYYHMICLALFSGKYIFFCFRDKYTSCILRNCTIGHVHYAKTQPMYLCSMISLSWCCLDNQRSKTSSSR